METSVLLYGEAEAYVQSLDIYTVKEIGSPGWFKQHEYLEKLNMQAILNASTAREEFIKELLVSHGKIPILVHEMILVEIWKQKVLPVLCQLQDFNPKSTFPLYMVVHHEATIINLLETVLFHKDSCEAAEDSLHDLVDYCHRKLTLLAGRASTGEHQALLAGRASTGEHQALLAGRASTGEHQDLDRQRDVSALKELQDQNAWLEFEISLKALSVLRYITDHADSIAVIKRMLCTHNLPCILVQMVEHCPWSRYSSGYTEKYIDGKWQKIPPQDHLKMTKLDGQVWIALYNLLLKEDCQRKYDFNNYNKNQLLKLRGFLTEVLMDQLPNLVELQRFLGHLGVTDPAPPKKDLVLEQIAEMWNSIMRDNSGKWKAIAKYQVKETFNPSERVLREQAQRLAQTYNLDVMENMLPDKPKCGACGKEAAKRCSRCQGEWYCHSVIPNVHDVYDDEIFPLFRECQVKHWARHKVACQLMAESSEKLQKDLDSQALD